MKTIKTYLTLAFLSVLTNNSLAQTNAKLDKVSHAEPLYFDLVRDLGARKGEKEINIAADFSKSKNHNEYAFLVEYEFAPINRLGLEVEADFSFFKRTGNTSEILSSKLESLRFSAQYSFLVSTKLKTTLAVGYTQILECTDFNLYGKENLITATVYNPFFVAAKRWGSQFHTLIYIGPLLEHHFLKDNLDLNWQINASAHFVVPGTKHFIGIELNEEIINNKSEITIRPQVKIKFNEKLALGIVTGLPVNHKKENYSSFFRIIYEL